MRVPALALLVASLVLGGCSGSPGELPSPGPWSRMTSALTGPTVAFPNLSYAPDELFKPLAIIKSATATGAARGHSSVAVVNGHLMVPFSVDSGFPGGGLSFYDLTDPRNPRLVNSVDHAALREAHGFGFSASYGGIHAVFQTIDGIQFWDISDVTNPVMIKHLVLPGIQASDYAAGAWWAFWQAPYVYVGGSGNGLYVVDATDITNPQWVTTVPTGRTGGFRLGPVYAFGNMLVASSADLPGYSVFDISDPRRPQLRATLPDGPGVYSILFNGNRIYGAGLDGRVHVHDVSNPSRIVPTGASPLGPGRGGYVSFQDGFVHGGFSEGYAKFDVRQLPGQLIGTGTSGIPNRDEDFGVVLGNLVFVGDDHGIGSALLPHQAGPDVNPPEVNAVNPADGATNQVVTTRVGLSFTDQVDVGSINPSSIIVRPLGGAPLPGKYSTQTNLASFAPDAPLLPDTTYEVVAPPGGVRDYAGNPLTTQFRSQFSTGRFIAGAGLRCLFGPITPAEIRATARLGIELSDATNATVSFNLGDGRTKAAGAGRTTVEHRYREPGHYTVIATASNGTETTTCSAVQTAYAPLTERRPTSAGTILHDGARNLVWVVNPDNDSVSAIDPVTFTRKLETRVGRNPRTLSQAPDGTIWVANQDDGTLSVVDGVLGTVVTTIPLGPGTMPYGVVFDPDGATAYVTLQATGQLVRLDPISRTVLGHVQLEGQVRGVAVDGQSRRVLVTRFISPEREGQVFAVRAGDCARVRTIDLAIDPGPDSEASGRGLPNYLTSITITPDGKRAYVASKKDNVQRGLARDGQRLTFETMVRTIVSQIDLRHDREDLRARKDLNDRDMAQAVAFSRYGDYAMVAVQGSNEVQILDAYSGALVGGIPGTGLAPQGVAFSADFRTLFVNNFMSRTVSAYDVSGLLDSSDTIARPLAVVPAVGAERLPFLALLGKQVFYNANDRQMNRDGYLSCASCHLDGDSDGRVWDFTQDGEGLRNTVALLGKSGRRHGPVHWSGNFDEIQDFEHSTRNFFGGTGFIPDALFNAGTVNQPLGDPKLGLSLELDGLAAFVSSLSETPRSPYRNPDGSMTAEGLAGKQLFGELGCASCHAGPELTDSAVGLLHDVGTLGPRSGQRLGQPLTGIDTPTLKGLWLTAPYLHDGSAATLYDVLVTRNRRGQHGATASLCRADLERLISYLLQLDDLEVPRARISDLRVADQRNAPAWFVRTRLNDGDFAYSDRGSILQGIPGPLLGMNWIRPAQVSRTFVGDPLVSFTIDRPAEVYVSIDVRAVPPPAWVDASWTPAGTLLVRESLVDFRPQNLYKKSFPAGPVSLGSLGRGDVNNYLVIVR
jgi:YVTN family beta-propeller protein